MTRLVKLDWRTAHRAKALGEVGERLASQILRRSGFSGIKNANPVTGQFLVHQRVDTTVGDTFWVQATTAPSTASGIVTIHDTAPTTDEWNYAAVEIVATR